MTIAPAGAAGKKAAGKGLGAWVQTHQKQAIFGGLGIGVVALALMKKKSAAAAAATTASSSTSAIDPSTGIPYSEELAGAQAAASSAMPYSGSSSGYGTGGDSSGGGTGYGDPLGTDITGLDSTITSLQAQLANPSGVNPGGPVQGLAPNVGPLLSGLNLIQPTDASGVTPIQPATPQAVPDSAFLPVAPPAAAINQTDSQAAAAYASGAVTASQALASETPAAAETAAQRHAQEVGNRALRAAAK